MTRARELADQHKTLDVDGGTIKLDGNYPVSTGNVALGDAALDDASLSGSYNTAIGSAALTANTSANQNTGIGAQALLSATTGGDNTAVGLNALVFTTTGAQNTAIGSQALLSNTTASNNTAVGYQAGYTGTHSGHNTYIGHQAGYAANFGSAANTYNTFVGSYAGSAVTTGAKNVIIGGYNGNAGGLDIRTASNYVVLADGDGNPRYVINNSAAHFITNESDFTNANNAILCVNHSASTRGINLHTTGTGGSDRITFQNDNGTVGTINTSGSSTSYGTSSDYRLKENVVDLTSAADRVQQLAPKRFNFIADADTTVDGFLAHEVSDIVPEAITGEKDAVDEDGNIRPQSIDQSKLVPLLTAALQEALTKIDALETRIVALETN
jgi:hypothetical protein